MKLNLFHEWLNSIRRKIACIFINKKYTYSLTNTEAEVWNHWINLMDNYWQMPKED